MIGETWWCGKKFAVESVNVKKAKREASKQTNKQNKQIDHDESSNEVDTARTKKERDTH